MLHLQSKQIRVVQIWLTQHCHHIAFSQASTVAPFPSHHIAGSSGSSLSLLFFTHPPDLLLHCQQMQLPLCSSNASCLFSSLACISSNSFSFPSAVPTLSTGLPLKICTIPPHSDPSWIPVSFAVAIIICQISPRLLYFPSPQVFLTGSRTLAFEVHLSFKGPEGRWDNPMCTLSPQQTHWRHSRLEKSPLCPRHSASWGASMDSPHVIEVCSCGLVIK